MTAPGFLKQPIIQRLPNLLDEIRGGELLVPRFQRPFVWSDKQRLDLLDSVSRGLPIGSILVWRSKEHALACHDRLGPLLIDTQAASSREVKQYLLDGHQRVATLYAAFNYPVPAVTASPVVPDGASEQTLQKEGAPERPDNGADARWPMYFDLVEECFTLQPRNGDVPDVWLPLPIVFDPYKVYEFQKRLFDRNLQELARRAQSLADTLRDYQIAVVPIVTEKLDVVTTSFQRTNSAGTRMSEVHMVNALTWTQKFDLEDRIARVQRDLEEVGWGSVDDETILDTCKALLGVDVYDSRLEDITKAVEEHPSVIEEAGRKLAAAARFLDRTCHIRGPRMLPYRLQAVFIAAILPDQPEKHEIAALERWLWVTTYLEYFGPGINATRVRNELERLPLVLEGETPAPPSSMKKVVSSRRFDFRAARSRAMALRMAEQEPRLPSGATFDAYQLLADAGHGAMPFVARSQDQPGGTPSSGVESRVVLPAHELGPLRELLRAPRQVLLFDERPANLDEILDSHAISPEACEAYAENNVARFLDLRRRCLLAIERRFVESLDLEYASDDGSSP